MFFSDLKRGVLAVSALVSVATAAECSREALLATAEKYVAAQGSGKLDDLQKLFAASNFAYQENNQIIDIKKGVIGKALKVEYSRSTADTVACASYTELVSLSPTPYVIATQIRHGSGVDTITMVDSIVATTGALFFNASATLGHFQKVPYIFLLSHLEGDMNNTSNRKTGSPSRHQHGQAETFSRRPSTATSTSSAGPTARRRAPTCPSAAHASAPKAHASSTAPTAFRPQDRPPAKQTACGAT